MIVSATLDEQYRALRLGAGASPLARDVLVARGPDVLGYLQGQLSQDVQSLAVGANAASFILQPHGKVDALVFLSRTEEDTVVLQVDQGYRPALLERLERFKLRTKVEFWAPDWKVLAVRGPEAATVEVSDGQTLSADWRGLSGIDVVGETPSVTGVVAVGGEVFEAYRIEVGIPRMGRELDERTIPAEAAVNDAAINFSKGCYTGQELVARIDSRGGNVPRILRGIVMDSHEAPPAGAVIHPNGAVSAKTKPIGVVTSSAYSPGFQAVVALAYVRREAMGATTGTVDWDHGPTPCRISTLPMTP